MDGLYPMGGVVADALLMAPLLRRAVNWLGVRRASSASIIQMFADGFKVQLSLLRGNSTRGMSFIQRPHGDILFSHLRKLFPESSPRSLEPNTHSTIIVGSSGIRLDIPFPAQVHHPTVPQPVASSISLEKRVIFFGISFPRYLPFSIICCFF